MLAYAEGASGGPVNPLEGTRAGGGGDDADAGGTSMLSAAVDRLADTFAGLGGSTAQQSAATGSNDDRPDDDADAAKLLPGARHMPTRQGGQGRVYETDRQILKFPDHYNRDPDTGSVAVHKKLAEIDPSRKHFVHGTTAVTDDGQLYHVLPRFQRYPSDYEFSEQQRAYLKQGVDRLIEGGILGHGDLKSDNVVYRPSKEDKPLIIDFDDTELSQGVDKQMITDAGREDTAMIDDPTRFAQQATARSKPTPDSPARPRVPEPVPVPRPPSPKRAAAADSRTLLPAIALPKVVFPSSIDAPSPTKAAAAIGALVSKVSASVPARVDKVITGLALSAAAPTRKYLQQVHSMPKRLELSMPRIRQAVQSATVVGGLVGAGATSAVTFGHSAFVLGQFASASMGPPLMSALRALIGGFMATGKLGAAATTALQYSSPVAVKQASAVVATELAQASGGVLPASAPAVQAADSAIVSESMAAHFLGVLLRMAPQLLPVALMMAVMRQPQVQASAREAGSTAQRLVAQGYRTVSTRAPSVPAPAPAPTPAPAPAPTPAPAPAPRPRKQIVSPFNVRPPVRRRQVQGQARPKPAPTAIARRPRLAKAEVQALTAPLTSIRPAPTRQPLPKYQPAGRGAKRSQHEAKLTQYVQRLKRVRASREQELAVVVRQSMRELRHTWVTNMESPARKDRGFAHFRDKNPLKSVRYGREPIAIVKVLVKIF
jgi:hypothetical protein